jgi:Fur family peroxide stress response transcriptional regulator
MVNSAAQAISERLEAALARLKTSGVRLTPQRYAILHHLIGSTAHPTADEIYRALEPKFPGMSVATVYNNLKMFTEAGLVKELTFGDHSSRFDGNTADHYHAVCDVCGKMVDFDFPPLYEVEQTAAKKTGFQIRSHRLEVHGTCRNCAG